MKIHSLLYHDIVSTQDRPHSGFQSAGAQVYKLSPELFRDHLCEIANLNLSPPTCSFTNLASHNWCITFDDGGASCFEASKILEEFGWNGIFFVTTDHLEKPGFLTSAQLQEMHQSGHLIGTHTCSHPLRISSLPYDQIVLEWKRSRERISEIVNHDIRVGSVPGGYYSLEVLHAASEAGIEVLFTSEPESCPRIVGNVLRLGRYGIQQHTQATQAAALVSSSPHSRWKQYCLWNSKKMLKKFLGRNYLTLRESILSRSSRSADSNDSPQLGL